MLSIPPTDRRSRQDERVRIPEPARLTAAIAALPAGAPLVAALADLSGVHLVGGAVRDLLLGGHPTDLDLVVEGELAPVIARLGGAVRGHDRFGTATVAVGAFCYDLARARRERYPHPGSLPEVEPAPLREDLLRRDFTVNAMAVALGGARAGELVAAPRATADLAARRLRVLHERSFIDDPTRLLRLARYRSRLGFAVAAGTLELVRQAVAAGALGTVSRARVGAELRLLAREGDPVAALEALDELGLRAAIHPRLEIDGALARRALALLPGDGRRDRLVLALAARQVPAGELIELLVAMEFEAGDRDAIARAALGAPRLARELAAARSPSQIALAVGDAGVEAVALAGALGAAEPAREWIERLRGVRLEIGGADLIAAGIPQGPAVGRGLRAALAAKLDGRAADRAGELAAAVAAAGREAGRS